MISMLQEIPMADDEDAAKETVANSSPAEPQTPKTSLQQHARSTTSAQVCVCFL